MNVGLDPPQYMHPKSITAISRHPKKMAPEWKLPYHKKVFTRSKIVDDLIKKEKKNRHFNKEILGPSLQLNGTHDMTCVPIQGDEAKIQFRP